MTEPDDPPFDPTAVRGADLTGSSRDDDPVLVYCANQEATDLGNARRFRRRHGDLAAQDGEFKAIRVAHIGWHVFDGKRWAEDQEDALVRPLAHATAEAIMRETALIKPTSNEQAEMDGGREAAQILADDDGALTPPQKADLEDSARRGREAEKAISNRRNARRKYARSSQNSGKITAMLTEAAPYVSRLVDDLNLDRLAVNCASGTIRFLPPRERGNPFDWWAADLRPHDSRDMITKCAQANWRPHHFDKHLSEGTELPEPNDRAIDLSPPAPEFHAFLKTVLPDEDVRRFLQRYFGYCLLGLTTEQVLLFFFGAGRNGKSTFMDSMTRVLGDYAVTLAIESLAGDRQRGGAEATPDLARLPGARLVAASEPEAGTKLKEALIKTMTGGEKFPVRRLHRDFFEIDPQFKMVISGNHKPVVTDDSDGTWRRLLLVPWDVQIPKGQVDVTLPDKLRAEADAIFAWLVEGALLYLDDRGLNPPEAITSASKEYRTESDPIDGFLLDACEITGVAETFTTSRALFEAYQRWCKETGAFEYTNTLFHRRLKGKTKRAYSAPNGSMQQFAKAKSNGTAGYRGIEVLPQYAVSAGGGGKYGDDDG
ncbi:MAG: phage/plasmid primase, P4 family [Pseudomonadota bacterium]